MVKRNTKKVKVAVKKKPKTTNEMTRLGYALRALGGLGGQMAGGLIGMPGAGGAAGSSLGAALSRWLGSGDYTVSSNSIVQKAQTPMGSIPSMHNDSQSIIVRHKEYLGPVLGSTGFSVVSSYSINPGLSQTFPWLSQVASRFQEYRIRGAVFHYVPTSGAAISGSNPALGSVMIQTSYRANDSSPTTKMEMMNEYWASEAAPSETFCHPIECNPKENPFNVQYVRNGDIPVGDSVLMYDIGQTFVATSGMPANGNPVGDLWITYEVELKKPVLYSNVAVNAVSSYVSFSGPPTTLSLFSGSVVENGNIDVSAFDNVTLQMKFPCVGTFYINVFARGTSAVTMTTVGAPTVTNGSLVPVSSDPNNVTAFGGVVGGNLVLTWAIAVMVVEPHKTVRVNFGNSGWTMPAGLATYVSITQRA